MTKMRDVYRGRPDLLADARALDRALRPVTDAVLARLGLTREQAIARAPRPAPAPGGRDGDEEGEAAK